LLAQFDGEERQAMDWAVYALETEQLRGEVRVGSRKQT
jgi:hypothetical protein